jgi:putative inorganic carbon (HCO3(-)) transporter
VPTIHFGLSGFVPLVLYSAGVVALLLSIFWKPIAGLYFLVPLIPLQTVRYHLIGLPLGQSLVDIIVFGIILGLLIRGEKIFVRTPWNIMLLVYAGFTFISLCLGSFYLNTSLPLLPTDPRFADWKNYMMMPIILFVVAATVKEKRQMKILVLLMCAATLSLDRSFYETVSERDFSAFSYDLRDEGGMGYAGVNGLAAYEAQITLFLLAISGMESKRWLKYGYLALAAFSAICLMYSLSRGGYAALLLGCLFLGIVKQRKLLIALAIFAFTWTSLVPAAVRERVMMTYDEHSGQVDHSAGLRLSLWEESMKIFETSPVVGVGFYTFAYSAHMDEYKDSHNIYVKVLVETGVVGLLVFLWLLATTFFAGFKLFRWSQDPFLSSLGLALATWVVCAAAANFFGDRWTFLQVNGYMWVLGGMVARGLLMEEEGPQEVADENSEVAEAGMLAEVPEPVVV